MDEVRIPNDATYSPVALTDVMLAAPLVSRVLLGATLPGRVIQGVALGAYAVSALQDWLERLGVRRIDFMAEFGADVHHLEPIPDEAREDEIRRLAERLNDGYTAERIPRAELARVVDRHLTDYIAGITGQRVETSTEVRSFTLAQVVFPFALGACDIISGDIAIFQDTGVLEPHVMTHEFAHRKGYYKELDAQGLAYLAQVSSGEPVLVQSALAERLHRNLRVVAQEDEARFRERVEASGLRSELAGQFLALRPPLGPVASAVSSAMKTLYEQRMKVTGQNGLSDYDRGFVDFLYSFERSAIARQRPPSVGSFHGVPVLLGNPSPAAALP
jgi:hypothetical protein